MEKSVPEIFFNRYKNLDVEVMNFTQLSEKINQSGIHNPLTPHRIQFYFILIVTKNTYTHFVDFKSYELSEGSAIFVSKNQVHNFTPELKNAEGFCLVFSSLFIEHYYFTSNSINLNRLFNYHIETPVIHDNSNIKNGFIDLAHHMYDEYSIPNEFAKSEILQPLLHILLLKAERTKQVKGSTKIHWLEIFSSFKNLLEQEYVNTRNSRLYATKLLISYKFLNDVVKELTGKTVKAFIDDYVIIEIKRFLVSTSLSVKEISYKTGFEEPTNMIKFFKKSTNTTPLHFRQDN